MILRRRKRGRALDKLRGAVGGRRKSKSARLADALRKKASGPAKTARGAGMAGRAAARSGKAVAVYGRRKASGKRAPLLASLPLFAGASVAGFIAVRRMRRGVKQTAPPA